MFDNDTLKEICSHWPEILVFYAIRQLGSFIFRMTHDMADGRIPEKDHLCIDADVQKAIEESNQIVKSLTRFGVLNPLDKNDTPTPEYIKWYKWWDGYERSLTTDQFNELERVIESKGDLSAWRPDGDWKTS